MTEEMNEELYKEEIGQQIKDIEVKDNLVRFIKVDDGVISLSYEHDQDCCESVYADFGVINYYKDLIVGKEFHELIIKSVKDMGFLVCFMNDYGDRAKVFIPCYNEQNGYYSSNLELIINDKTKIDISGLVEHHID
jgi:hypothetical protein